jgi:hypothetical protein
VTNKFTDDEAARIQQEVDVVLRHYYTPEQIAEMKNPKPKAAGPAPYFPPLTPKQVTEWDALYGVQAKLAKVVKTLTSDLAREKRLHAVTREELDDAERKIKKLNDAMDDGSH